MWIPSTVGCWSSEGAITRSNFLEYLLLKGIEAVSIHGSKDSKDRSMGLDLFRQGKKDVLVATDVASKGLDFENIQHVINYDMPEDIENYGLHLHIGDVTFTLVLF